MTGPHQGDPPHGDPRDSDDPWARPGSSGGASTPGPYGPPGPAQPWSPPYGGAWDPNQPSGPAVGQPYPAYGTDPWGPPPGQPHPAPSHAVPGQPTYTPGPSNPVPPAAPPSPNAPDQFSAMTTRPRKTPVVVVAGVAVAVLVIIVLGVTAFWTPGFAVTTELSQSAVQAGVRSVLEGDYQAKDVQNVSCPSGQEVVKGHSFRCTASVAGAQQRITVTFLDDDGTYEVAQPTAD